MIFARPQVRNSWVHYIMELHKYRKQRWIGLLFDIALACAVVWPPSMANCERPLGNIRNQGKSQHVSLFPQCLERNAGQVVECCLRECSHESDICWMWQMVADLEAAGVQIRTSCAVTHITTSSQGANSCSLEAVYKNPA